MSKKNNLITGSLAMSGVTIYTRKGRQVMRTAASVQPERRTRAQFVLRERIAHSVTLWQVLKNAGTPVFEGGANAYARFRSLMCRLEPVFLTSEQHAAGASLLMPGMPLSEGTLPTVGCRLGMVDGRPALVTDLALSHMSYSIAMQGEHLVLYALRQSGDGNDVERVEIEPVQLSGDGLLPNAVAVRGADGEPQRVELVCHEGCLALTGDLFADPTRGWGVVRLCGNKASTQCVLTQCDTYRRYTTEEALQRAAESYGGLTE